MTELPQDLIDKLAKLEAVCCRTCAEETMAALRWADAALHPRANGADMTITINPHIQFGRPCIVGTRVPTDVLAGAILAGESSYDDEHGTRLGQAPDPYPPGHTEPT